MSGDVQAFLEEAVKSKDVLLFKKCTPTFPQCGVSSVVVKVQDYLGVEYEALNVLNDQAVREGIKIYSNWPTIPQLYVKGEFIGGADIIRELFQAGELQEHFAGAGIPVTAEAPQ